MNYEETIQYLYDRLPVFHQIGAAAYKPGLEKSVRMMEHLGNPQRSYKCIHVAGTNGKGSVSHFLSAILQAAGYKVGLYTSPHLVDFRERIRVNGEKVTMDYVVDFVRENKEYFEEIQPSFFEATMAMAFRYFSDCNVDVAVVEVGLGGRLDSTNIIQPVLSVITNIGLDHTEFLGNSLAEIASEKAGIIKPETPVVIGETTDETKLVFLAKAKSERSAIVFSEEKHLISLNKYEEASMLVRDASFGDLEVGLMGAYQIKNAATALTSVDELRKLGFTISDGDVRRGLKNVVQLSGLHGRWQVVSKSPTVILDTGHNKEGIGYVVKQLKLQKFNRLHVVIGMVSDKDVSGVLELLPAQATYYFTAAQTKRALSPSELQAKAAKIGLQGKAYDTVELALKEALSKAEQDDLIFVGGSNFIVGEALPVFY